VKTTAVPGARGFDKAKLINGRERHLFVDTLGLLLAVVVTAASVQDRDGARLLLSHFGGLAGSIVGAVIQLGRARRLVVRDLLRVFNCTTVL
jgi:putative transposase